MKPLLIVPFLFCSTLFALPVDESLGSYQGTYGFFNKSCQVKIIKSSHFSSYLNRDVHKITIRLIKQEASYEIITSLENWESLNPRTSPGNELSIEYSGGNLVEDSEKMVLKFDHAQQLKSLVYTQSHSYFWVWESSDSQSCKNLKKQ